MAINLSTLDPEEWLDDSVINRYCVLLQKTFQEKIFIFSTFFFESLKRSGFDYIKKWTKNYNIFSKNYIIFPLHEKSHWILAFQQ